MTTNHLVALLLVVLTITLGSPSIVLAYQDEVDWMWNNTKPSAGGGCKNFIVKAGRLKFFVDEFQAVIVW